MSDPERTRGSEGGEKAAQGLWLLAIAAVVLIVLLVIGIVVL